MAFSDRRAVKVLKLVAASAVLCGRSAARVSDFWVFRYVWDREEQIAPLAALVAGVIEPHAGEPDAHPLAGVPDRVDGEEIARQLDSIATGLATGRWDWPPSLGFANSSALCPTAPPGWPTRRPAGTWSTRSARFPDGLGKRSAAIARAAFSTL